jgi:glycerophosphoryl diester phosphodiesterase
LATVRAALDCGWGVETDIRCAADGRFYISHDARPSAHERPAEDSFALFRAYPDATVALNIKELGCEEALIRLLDHEDVVGQTFLFDMELLEQQAGATARTFRELHPTIRIAARISDRSESIEQALSVEVASVIWLDEFDGPCFTESDIRRLKQAGRSVYAVSPDLHGKPAGECRRRWLEFIRWGVDGICTDYPAALAFVSRAYAREVAA